MSKRGRCSARLLLCFCCQCASYTWAGSVASAPAVVHTQEALRTVLASGKPTPLDVLTPYGKREAIRQLRWNERGLTGFGFAPLIRELDHAQLAAVLRFLDTADYLPMLDKRLVGPPLRLPAPSRQVEDDLQALQQFADENERRHAEAVSTVTEVEAPVILQRYQELFSARLQPSGLHTQPLGDLVPLFNAASLAANQNPASQAVDDMLRLHREVTARGIDTRRTFDDAVLRAMLAARRFEEARQFIATRPHLADVPVPLVIDPLVPSFRGRSAFAYDAARNVLTRLALPISASTELVMVVGAGCHNSDNALQAIQDDSELRARLREANLVLVTAPNAPLDTNLITRWNAANPTLPISVPYSPQEWHGIEVTGIPAFFLLKNGKLVAQRTGWPAEGKSELVKLIDAVVK